MNANSTNDYVLNTAVEDLAAEIAETAYPIVLRNAVVDNWLDLELELWRTLKNVVGKWSQEWPQAGVIIVSPLQQEMELP